MSLHSEEGSRHGEVKLSFLGMSGKLECERCGYSVPGVLSFHHFGQKDFEISEVMIRRRKVSEKEILAEMEKCNLLCKNCHAKEQVNWDRMNRFWGLIQERAEDHKECPPAVSRMKVSELLKIGMKKAEVARELGCSKSTVTNLSK
jgi:hypothetical protein